MFKVEYSNYPIEEEMLLVYAVDKDKFLVYLDCEWKWIDMCNTRPYVKVVGM